MRNIIGIILLLLGVVYILGAIFHRMIWIFARSFSNGIMIVCVLIGIYLLFSKGED